MIFDENVNLIMEYHTETDTNRFRYLFTSLTFRFASVYLLEFIIFAVDFFLLHFSLVFFKLICFHSDRNENGNGNEVNLMLSKMLKHSIEIEFSQVCYQTLLHS